MIYPQIASTEKLQQQKQAHCHQYHDFGPKINTKKSGRMIKNYEYLHRYMKWIVEIEATEHIKHHNSTQLIESLIRLIGISL